MVQCQMNSQKEQIILLADIDNQGSGYSGGLGQEVNILGDGSGAKVVVDVVSGLS